MPGQTRSAAQTHRSHRHPALEAVRAEIEDRVPGRRWKHRLAEFNAEASFEDVKAVLTSAIVR
jgi:hypothetical protein